MFRSMIVDDIQIAFDDYAAGSGVSQNPLLLLHGAVQTRSIWNAQVPHLAGTRRIILPDLRGHGDTTSGTQHVSVERLALDAFGLLDRLGVDAPVVCGVSLGGMVALEMAAMRPTKVSALVLANTPLALSDHPWARSLVDWIDPHRMLRPTFRLLGRARTARVGLALAGYLVGPHWVGSLARRHFVKGFTTMSEEAIVATFRAIVESRPVDLSRLTQPCLIIMASNDAPTILRQSDEILDQAANAKILTIDAGHVANLDDPAAFNDALEAFLDRHA